jgi:hypothetical protein
LGHYGLSIFISVVALGLSWLWITSVVKRLHLGKNGSNSDKNLFVSIPPLFAEREAFGTRGG